MAVAWSAVAEASRLGKTGHINEALRLLISLEPQCESDCDRAALSLAKSSCFAHLGQITEAFAYIETAKKFAATHRELMLQIEMSEAAGRILSKEYQTACALYEHIAATYTDLLSEDPESAGEFNERYGYALFHVERYGQAIDIFRSLIQSKRLEDEQRVRLYLGAALAGSRHPHEAQIELELAAKGPNSNLSKDALDRLIALSRIQ